MASAGQKNPDALKTIGELSDELGIAQHILRYWETKFPQLRPMQRAGNRRYYRPDDVALARRINSLLNEEGYTVRGVQKLLRDKGAPPETKALGVPLVTSANLEPTSEPGQSAVDVFRLISLRNRLLSALES